MDNQQFRKLVLGDARKQDGSPNKSPASRASSGVLGARKNASIPMTPRQVGRSSVQADFARQLAERNAKTNPTKKWKSSAPKGVKLAAGYTDRTKDRTEEEEDELAQRIKNLEESVKKGELDRETFHKLVQELTAGDLNTTHLVKGLDRKLLERIRRGEDVLSGTSAEGEREDDIDQQLEELENQEVGRIVREKAEKNSEMAPAAPAPAPVAGVKRSRNDILAELKAQRKAAAEAAAAEHKKRYPALGPRFRKVTSLGDNSRLEIDSQGREVLIITGPDGKEKRKVRKQKKEETEPEVRYDLDDPKNPVKIPNAPKEEEPEKKDSEDDDDIFEGVGSTYNPLANLDDEDDSDSSSEEDGEASAKAQMDQAESKSVVHSPPQKRAASESGEESSPEPTTALTLPEPTASAQPSSKRDWFAATSGGTTSAKEPANVSSADATVMAALKKVRTLDPNSSLLQNDDSEEARLRKRAAKLTARDRDMEDMDMDFGGSRFEDADDMERDGEKVKFSEWKGIGAEDNEGNEGERGAKKRKRGPKKKKVDKNNVEHVMKAMERQREKKPLG
ncbi:hypothetical protein BS50DRAFT_528966 [Corynespora cassiicola Philippines]|uniref:RED-like N-terminal domain-containing protein n=1 Tax=Corynespora cassiicola Philippines TaxID=1448308 RepID=A0A2T2NGR8_CORCC|nr:hypothetical protein BS50DRAFT_528966 [Corynespora cassiicola Philippines]